MGIILMVLSGLCGALSNLMFRRSLDGGGNGRVYLLVQLAGTALVMVLLYPVRTGDFSWSHPIGWLGLAGGIVLGLFMTCFGKALEKGPPGLTVAMLNASSVLPILLLLFLFGSPFGFQYSLFNGLGSLLVVLGLFWASSQGSGYVDRKKWLIFILIACLIHALYLAFLQWRSLFILFPGHPDLGVLIREEEVECGWFMPMVFASAALVQVALFLTNRAKLVIRGHAAILESTVVVSRREIVYGLIGAVTNAGCGFLTLWATEVATSLEKPMIFPVFSVTLLVACNLWGKWLYKEQIHWKGNSLAVAGLVVGTVALG